ncbi:MAG: aminopeptidase, partial [Alphaproteobacteria bacterium]
MSAGRVARVGAAALAATLLLGGCAGTTAGYLVRAGWEEARILWRRRPIDRVLAEPGLDPAVRAKLVTVLAVREFGARRLGLSVGGAYGSYAEVDEGAVVQVLSAAERLRLVPVTWWFPIVGSVAYKGYFSPEDARREAERLESRGYDTWVRGAVAFSTLGWLDDPVLSNWMKSGRVELAELVLHELLHRTTYLPSQTDFNESFATFAGHAGAIAFFTETEGEGAADTAEARRRWDAEIASSAKLGSALARLRSLYATAEQEGRPEAQVRDERRAIFAEIGDPAKLNNAVLLSRKAYLDRLAWFAEVGRRTGNVRAAIEVIREASEKRAREPWEALRELAGVPAEPAAPLAPAAATGPTAPPPAP